jgi:hypothetical protein
MKILLAINYHNDQLVRKASKLYISLNINLRNRSPNSPLNSRKSS